MFLIQLNRLSDAINVLSAKSIPQKFSQPTDFESDYPSSSVIFNYEFDTLR